ncbi:MAG: hypothetical protein KC619_15425 [Myxococcales bacterium]|nr:hypothetical protein [Myxococcales bacterium]
MRWWWSSFGKRYAISLRGFSDAETAVSAAVAQEVIAEWARDEREATLRAVLYDLGGVVPSTWATRGDLARELMRYAGGDLLVAREPEPTWLPSAFESDDETEANEPDEVTERHDLLFTFEYPDRSAAGGWGYRFTDLDGNQSSDVLPDDGRISESDVREGTYQVELKMVRSVHWLEKRVDCGTEVGLVAHVEGYDDGEAAQVRLFRQFKELDRQVVDTVSGQVADGRVECTYTYDHTANDRRAAEEGRVRLIAEVSLEDGKVWCKTLEPVVVQLKSLDRVGWSAPQVQPGIEVEVFARVSGYADGAEVAFALWLDDPMGGAQELTELRAPIVGGTARTTLLYAPSSEPSDPAFEAGRIQQPGEYFVRAVIEDEVRREARSDVVLCDGRALDVA